MEIQIYSCSSTFPSHIEEVLREKKYIIEPLSELHSATNKIHGSFSFRIRKGMGELKVLGSEVDGTYLFHIVGGNDLDSLSRQAAEEMLDDVEAIMLTNGADLYKIEEL
jgi:3-methyladenine DNA glycosylase AlkD